VRAVFDTNIYVSAFAIPGGQAEAAVHQAIEGRLQLVISKAIVHELLDVLARKFERDSEELARVAVLLSDLAEVVNPRRRIDVLRDAADNRILECAVAARADVIVTGDKAMLDLGEYEGIRILALREFLESRKGQ
jgi:putative PIN family toxin of toxin-antitoxin system